jgi:hypothetical protein
MNKALRGVYGGEGAAANYLVGWGWMAVGFRLSASGFQFGQVGVWLGLEEGLLDIY